MWLTWRQRIEQSPSLANFNNWPEASILSIKESDRRVFALRKKVVLRVLGGMSLKEASRLVGVSKSQVTYIMNRCLAGDEKDEPWLTDGLFLGKQLRKPTRKETLFDNVANQVGARCAFAKILRDNPCVVERIDQLISTHINKSKFGENQTVSRAHRAFIKALKELNWPKTCYPLDRDKQGFESFRKYFRKREIELRIPKPKYPTTDIVQPTPMRAFEEIQIDEQKTDVMTRCVLEIDGQLKPLRLPRLHYYVARCVATNCTVATHLCLNSPPNHEDLLALIEKIFIPWKPLTLTTPGLEYAAGAGYPSCISNELENVGIGTIRLDNALAHHAKNVSWFICEEIGATLNLGIPGRPTDRCVVEHGFKTLNRINHRFTSTTGSNVCDPNRESKINSKSPPELTFQKFVEILDVTHASLNAERQSGSSGSSPLDQIRYQFQNLPMQLNFASQNLKLNPFLRRLKRNVNHIKHESRKPFLSYKGMHYKGSCLHSLKLVGNQVEVEIDIRDIRRLQVYDLSGVKLGEVMAPKSQQNFKLSLRTYDAMKREAKKDNGLAFSRVDEYFDYKVSNVSTPLQSLEVLRIWREIETSSVVDIRPNITDEEKIFPFEKTRSKGSKVRIPKWTELQSTRGLPI